MLGLEPLYLACEGTMVIIAPAEQAEKIVETLHQCPYSQNAAIIGTITEAKPRQSYPYDRNRNPVPPPTAGWRVVA